MSVAASTTKIFRKGLIFREGDRGETMYVIRSGKVKITKNMYGIMVRIAELGPGDYFGEMTLLEGVPRSASAIAETPVEVDVLERDTLRARIAAEPELAMTLLKGLSHRLRQIDDKVTDLVARGRLPKEEASAIGQHSLV